MDLNFKELAEAKKDAILKDLSELIAIDSSEDLKTPLKNTQLARARSTP